MTQHDGFVGIDVSKAQLDACLWPDGEARAFANDTQGLRDLLRWLHRLRPQSVGFEASGGYERALLAALCAARLPARRVNPARLRQFARAAGVLAKNDRIDAAMIARFCAALPQREARHDPLLATLAGLVTARRQLCEERTRCTHQAEQADHPLVKRLARQRIKRLAAEILLLETEIARILAGRRDLADKHERLRSAPGVGPVTAATLIAFMPELGSMTGRQAAALVGVAPFDCESGTFKGKRRIIGGRKPLRDALYMAALVASRANPVIAAFYQRMKSAGKPPKVAIVAAMRKLLVALNAMLRDHTNWKNA
ncbi:IS110 family transposase [Novosphingobium kaempferiae]|uniref:IS110 family transposase n=1 Tax=Novosphingobium kaempferiae TaxID=2896849 RepID=UPI003B8486D6